jgi:hypothetical protein
MASGSSGSVGPLSVGNVVSAGLRLYRANWKQFLSISWVAALWMLLPFGVLLGIALFFAFQQKYYATLGLLIPAWIVLFVYCSAKHLERAGLLARLAYLELANQPEPLADSQRFTRSRTWQFFFTALLTTLLSIAVVLGIYLLVAIVAIGMVLVGYGFLNRTPLSLGGANSNGPLLLIFGLIVLVIMSGVIAFFCWFTTRLAGVEVPLAVEPNLTAGRSIGRFWQLTKGNVWRVFWVLLVAFLVTLPIQVVAQLGGWAAQSFSEAIFPKDASQIYGIADGVAMVLTYILTFALGILTLPLWQSVKAAIYYDLRSRQEGLGLQLRDR